MSGMATVATRVREESVASVDEARGRTPMDQAYFLGTWALMVVGIVFVFSASFPVDGRPDAAGVPGDPFRHVTQHAVYVGIALIAMLLASRLSLTTVQRASGALFMLSLVLAVLAWNSPWSVVHGGAPRWLKIWGLPEFQPSELLKIAFILVLAGVLARRDEGKEDPGSAWGAVIIITAIVGAVMLLQSDQGMATIFALIMLSLLFLAGMRLSHLIPLSLVMFLGGVALAYREPYRWERIKAFLDPENAGDAGYHIVNMLIANARGGILGTGIGMSPDKWRSLPAPHTDSIFSVIGCELGLVGALALMAGIALLAWRGLSIARDSRSRYGYYLAGGVTAMLTLQAIAHIAVNTSCMPCTGLTLPFISGGGTSLLSAAVAAGLVLAVSRQRRCCEP